MPRIPTLTPQLKTQLPSDVRFDYGPINTGYQAIGEGIAKLGEGIAQGVDNQDKMTLMNTDTELRYIQQKYTNEYNSLEKNQINQPDPNPNGDANLDRRDSILQRYRDEVDAMQKELPARLHGRFLYSADRFYDELDIKTKEHQVNQEKKVNDDIWNGAIGQELNNVANYGFTPSNKPDWMVINQSLARGEYVAEQAALGTGNDPEVYKQNFRARTYATVIDGLLNKGEVGEASAIYRQQRHTFDEKTRDRLDKVIVTTADAQAVQNEAQAIMQNNWDMKRAMEAVDALGKNNPTHLIALRSEVQKRIEIRDSSLKKAQADVEGTLWSMIFPADGSKPRYSINESILKMPDAWNSLPDGGAALKQKMMEYERRQNEIEVGVKPLSEAEKVSKYALYQKVMDDPNALIKMTDNQIASLTGTLGVDLTNDLIKKKRDANNNIEQLKIATMNDIKFNDIVGEFSIKTKGKLTPVDEAKLGMIRYAVGQSIASEQLITGKPLLPDRKEEILRKVLTKEITTGNYDTFLKIPIPGTEKTAPIYMYKTIQSLPATDEEKKMAVDYITAARARAGITANVPIVPMDVWELIQALRDARKVGVK
jgi:hypothetical protein